MLQGDLTLPGLSVHLRFLGAVSTLDDPVAWRRRANANQAVGTSLALVSKEGVISELSRPRRY